MAGTIGDGGRTLESLQREHGFTSGAVDFLFIDHDKNSYLADLLAIVDRSWLHPGSIVVADNVGFPGSPKYRAHIVRLRQHRVANDRRYWLVCLWPACCDGRW